MKRVLRRVTICVAVIGMVCAYFGSRSKDETCEKIVEFTYSRTQPCNTDYYNYGFSIGPLRDVLMCWGSMAGASRLGFHEKVQSWLKTHSSKTGRQFPNESIEALCRNVSFVVDAKEVNRHPIKCKMILRGDDRRILEVLAMAFKECMAADVELTNAMFSEKATMRQGVAYQKHVQNLAKLRKARGQVIGDKGQLDHRMVEAEREMKRCKAEWDAAIKAYREKWDASLVFLHEADASKCRNATDGKE